MSSKSSGNAGRSARSALWMTPWSSHAPEPSSSFSSGIPNRITALTPRRTSSSTSTPRSSTEKRPIAGSASFARVVGPTKSGITKSSSSSRVSRTSERSAPLERRRRSRVAGKALTGEGYALALIPGAAAADDARMATRSKTVRVVWVVATIVVAVLLVARAIETRNALLIASAVAVLLSHFFLLARKRLGVGAPPGADGLPRRFPLSRVVSAEQRGNKLVLRSIDGRTARVRYTSAPADAELVARLRAELSATGVELPDPPEPKHNQTARGALVLGVVIGAAAAAYVVADASGPAHGAQRLPQAIPVTAASFAARAGTFTEPFAHIARCPAYVVPLDVDSYGPAHFVIAAMHTTIYEGRGGGCVTHPLKLSPAVVDPDRHQLNTHLVMDELRAAYVRAHGRTPARVIGLTEFDLFSPTAPGEAFVTIDEAVYGSQVFGVGSSAHGHLEADYASIGHSLSG